MEEKREHLFCECVNMVERPFDFGYKNNVLIVKHNNAFFKRGDEIKELGAYHSYSKSHIKKPYEPFLDIIKDYAPQCECEI